MNIAYDKKLHFIAGLLITLFFGMNNPMWGVITGAVAGVVKEVFDYFDYGLFDKYDMLATWAGVAVGYGILLVI